jgi:hypothetical protein
MADSSRLVSLASTIQAKVLEIHNHLESSGQADPSFDSQVPYTNYSGIDDTRASVLDSLTELQDLLSTPQDILKDRSAADLLSRHALDRFQIYDLVPVGETRTYTEIANATGQPVNVVRRILRHAMAQRIFCEPQRNTVAHTQVSRLLTENTKVRDYYGTICEIVWPAMVRTVDAMEKWPGSRDPRETGYYLATGETRQQTLEENPAKHKRYDNAMGAFATDRSYNLGHVSRGYDWNGLGKATIVDVGGGTGVISMELAKTYPELNFVVEDLPDVIANAVVPDEFKDRIKFIAHDFFEEQQPVKGADVYFMRRVLMDWPDDKVVVILQSLIPALKEGARVLIQESYVPDPGSGFIWQERRFRSSDMLGLAFGGGERDLEDWCELFRLAGSEFIFNGIKGVPNSDIVFIEAVARGKET